MRTTRRIATLGALVALSMAPAAAQATDQPDPPTVAVTPDIWVSPFDYGVDGAFGLRFCGARDPGHNSGTCVDREPYQPGWASQQLWGSASNPNNPIRTAGMGINSGPVAAVALGEPFVLADMGHWNIPYNGNAMTTIGIHGAVTVESPGAEPVEVSLQIGEVINGASYGVHVNFIETDNQPPCNPDWQETQVSCDDIWRLFGDQRELEQPIVRFADAGGVRYTLTILGWQKPSGSIPARWVVQEDTVTARPIMAKLTVSRTSTATDLVSDSATSTAGDPVTFTATVDPPPSPGGTVAFRDGDTEVAGCAERPVDPATGVATCTTSALTVGDHSITAAYSGAIGFDPSTSGPLPHTVTPGTPVDPRCGEAPGTDRVGTARGDVMRGTAAAERFDAKGGVDTIQSAGGDDCLTGGSGIDFITAGPGDDSIESRDGQLDVLVCGTGEDRAVIDRRDLVSGCEEVSRG